MKDKIRREIEQEAEVMAAAIKEKLAPDASPLEHTRALFQALYESGKLGEDREEALAKYLNSQKHSAERTMAIAGVMLMMHEDDIPEMAVKAFKDMLTACILFTASLEMIDEECEKEEGKDE